MKAENAFGDVLQRRRKLTGLSQEKLAEKSRLDRTFISLLERGLRQPSLPTLLTLSRALGIPAADLVREVEERVEDGCKP